MNNTRKVWNRLTRQYEDETNLQRLARWWEDNREIVLVVAGIAVFFVLTVFALGSWVDATKARTIAEMQACKDAHYEWVQISRDVFACYKGPQ